MTTSQPFDFDLNRPGALIAGLPAVLGFVPEKSLVLITIDRGEMGCVLRIDLSQTVLAAVGQLCDTAAAACPDAAIAVIIDDAGAGCRMCSAEHRELADELAVGLRERGIELLAAHVVDRVAAGGQWRCADECGRAGAVDDPSASPLTMAAVLEGRRLYDRRADLEQVVDLDAVRSARLADVVDRCAEQRGDRTDADARTDIENVLAASARVDEGIVLGDDALAGIACALTDSQVRDPLYALAVGERAAQAEALWVMLSRCLPSPWRAEALVLLAFSAYVRGDGPLAGVSLEAALRCQPNHRMAGMLDTALQSGMRPEQISELAMTGFRLADRLGVRLPRRQMFNRRAG